MRERTTRNGATTHPDTWAQRRAQVNHWRRYVRPHLLRQAATATRGLQWSPRLVKALLDELHVYDESLALTGASAARTDADLPRLVLVALLLRHSWHPYDLAELATRVGASAVVPISPAALDPPHLAAPRRGDPRTSPSGPRARKEPS